MEIDRDAGDPRNLKVPRRNRVAESLEIREADAAHAAIDMTVDISFGCDGSNGLDGIDDALWILRRRADQQHRVVIDRCSHCLGIRSPIFVHRNASAFETEVVTRLFECGVSTGGQHHVGLGDAALFLAALA